MTNTKTDQNVQRTTKKFKIKRQFSFFLNVSLLQEKEQTITFLYIYIFYFFVRIDIYN